MLALLGAILGNTASEWCSDSITEGVWSLEQELRQAEKQAGGECEETRGEEKSYTAQVPGCA